MNFNKYQKKASEFAVYSGNEDCGLSSEYKGMITSMAYPLLGLAEESGEVCGRAAKAIRRGDTYLGAADREDIAKELGDVLWMVSQLALHLDYTLEDIAKMNLDKLTIRKEKGKIVGSGDNR